MVERRDWIEAFLKENYPGWVVVRPVRGEIDDRCVFQNPEKGKEAVVKLPQRWFDNGDHHQIEQEIRRAIGGVVVRG